MSRRPSLALVVGLSLSLAPLLTSCGGGEEDHPPTISNLSFTPTYAVDNTGGKPTSIAGYCDFRDSDGNVTSFQVTTYNSSGIRTDEQTIPLPSDLKGVTAGRAGGTVTVKTTPPDVYRYRVCLIDEEKNRSNYLEGLFPVVLPPSSNPTVYASGRTITSVTSDLGAARGVTIDTIRGDIFVVDSQEGKIFKFSPASWTPSTYASNIPSPYDLDFNIYFNRLFVSSRSGSNNDNIYQIYPAGTPVLYSTGYSDPTGVKALADGSLFITDSGNGTIWRIPPTGGSAQTYLSGYSAPCGLSFDSARNLYFADQETGRIFRAITPQSVTLLATLPHLAAGAPSSLVFTAVDSSNAVYVSDSLSGSIYKISSGGTVTLFASGFAAGGPGGMVFDGSGTLYVAGGNTLWRIP